MSLNMKTLTQALAKASAVIEKTVQTTVQEVTGLPKPMQDYQIIDQIGSAGPALAWKLYSAKPRDGHAASVYLTVCVWVLDKKALSEARQRAGLSKAAEDAFLDVIRADATRLVRLRHPGVVHVVQALDESKNVMAMVTEPLFASVANALGNVENISTLPKELKGMEMGLLEVKHGLLQITETLDFLHNNARLVHRALAPESVLITAIGAWKLGGFGFSISTDQSSSDPIQAFHYAEYDVEDSMLPLQPSINYTAPELVRSKTSSVGCTSDVFSLACLSYHLVARKPLFDCHNNVKMYTNSLTYLTSESFSTIPKELVPNLLKMLSKNEALRPSALDFTGSSFFREDTRLRALRFLDHMLERDNIQKTEFLKALSDMWKDFDSRVLRYKVLPPLCAELRNVVMQPMILPMVLTIAESQDKNDFEVSSLPALVPVLNTASGETLLLLVKHVELFINKASQEHLISHVLPMLVRAYDDSDSRLQEEVLKKTIFLAKRLDVQIVNQVVLPRVHGLALKTTVAAVRVNALLCFSDMVRVVDKKAILDVLQTIQQCTAVDHSAPTLMSTLGVANSILKQFGIEFVAEYVLPLLIPLLITQQLNVEQFAKYMLFVKNVLRQIEEKRGVTLTVSGISELRPSPAAEGIPSGQNKTAATSASVTKRSLSWDEDWLPASVASTAPQSVTATLNTPLAVPSQPLQVNTRRYPISTSSSVTPIQEQPLSGPAVDNEWPPRSLPGVKTLFGDNARLNVQNGSSDASLGGIDPFANWPPRSSGSSSDSNSFNHSTIASSINNYRPTNGATSNGLNQQSTSFAASGWQASELNNRNQGNIKSANAVTLGSGGVNSHNSASEVNNQNQGNIKSANAVTLGSGGVNSHNSLGYMKQNHVIYTLGSSTEGTADLGSIFAPNKSEHFAPRLAPPPTAAVGKVRGRGRGIQGQGGSTAQMKPKSDQPPLLDLL